MIRKEDCHMDRETIKNNPKKMVKWIIPVLAGLLIGIWCILFFIVQIPWFDSGGWRTNPYGQKQYLNYYGVPLKQWQELEGNRYFFDPKTGEMRTGWMESEEGVFCFTPSGAQQCGFVEHEGAWYYLLKDGTLCTGWIDTPEGRCYADESGKLYTGWKEIEEVRHYFDESGRQITGWFTQEEGTYYLDSQTGVHTGWLETDGKRYWFGDDGLQYTGWLALPEGRYYLPGDGSRMEGIVTVDNVDRYFTAAGEYIPLVNKWNSIPADFALNLVEVEDYQVDASCKDALIEMLNGCRAADLECVINSAYRSIKDQQELWDQRFEEYRSKGNSWEEADRLTSQEVAIPGTSEHHLGLAVDIGGTSKTHRWLEEHSWEFGFIRRYPDEKLEITGIVYEPWHYRYLGMDLA